MAQNNCAKYMANNLEKEFKFFLEHQAEFVKKYDKKFVVIKNQQILGVYNDAKTAFLETQKKHAVGSFLIQECRQGVEAYTQILHSRVLL
jgi:hypothetical protein